MFRIILTIWQTFWVCLVAFSPLAGAPPKLKFVILVSIFASSIWGWLAAEEQAKTKQDTR